MALVLQARWQRKAHVLREVSRCASCAGQGAPQRGAQAAGYWNRPHGPEVLVFGPAGDHCDVGKMMRCPGNFLRFRPSAFRTSGQNNRLQVGDSFVKVHGIGDEREVAVEVAASSDPTPECFWPLGAPLQWSQETELEAGRSDAGFTNGKIHAKVWKIPCGNCSTHLNYSCDPSG